MRIFLSYAQEDKSRVEEIYRRLSAAGFSPWMATMDILPGESWGLRIKKAIVNSDIFLACLSTYSVHKRGWIQREIKLALDVWSGMLPTDLFLIPVRLEPCNVPDSLNEFQVTNLYEEDGWARLLKSIETAIARRSGDARQSPTESTRDTHLESPPEEQRPALKSGFSLRAIDLAFVEEGSLDCVLYWRNEAAFDFQRNEWKPMATALVPEYLSGYLLQKEVFLCLRGDHLLEGYDHIYIKNTLEVVRKLIGKTSLYLVKDISIGVSALEQRPLSLWMNEVFRGGATDIIEVEMANRYSLQPLNVSKLRTASDISRWRRKIISPLDWKEEWKCWLPRTEYFLLWFLEPFAIHLQQEGYEGNVIIVLKSYQASQRQFLTKALKTFTRKILVVWLNFLPPVAPLQSLCGGENLKLIHCHGPFELRYLLLRLNQIPVEMS